MHGEPSHREAGEQARRYLVSGRVQGVGYRFFVRQVAEALGLSGFAKNLIDGRVEVYAIGSAAALESLGAKLRRGPAYALVEDVDEKDAQVDSRFARAWGFSVEED